jgi:hypothetical protein
MTLKKTPVVWDGTERSMTLTEQQLIALMNHHIDKAIDVIYASGSLPTDHMEFLRGEQLSIVLEKADSFLFPGSDKKSQEFFNTAAKSLAVAIAIMSFTPGGVRFFGFDYESIF